MPAFKIKVCGMKHKDNILEVASCRPDYLGFIFYKNSPRFVGEDFQVPVELNASIKRVGVFVNESTERIIELSQKHQLDLIQLHGDETVSQCQLLKSENLGVIKVFAVDEKFDFDTVIPYESFVDYFLFDCKGKLPGGNGIPFDWKVLTQYKRSVPFFLSGGISIDNAGQIRNLEHPNLYAIDVNSGVEDAPGIKNKNMLKELLTKI